MAKDDDDLLPKKKTSSTAKKSSSSSSGKSSGTGSPSPQMLRLMRIGRTIGIILGGFVTLVGMMSVVGFATDNFWARLIVALVVVVGFPAFVSDRVLKRTKLGGGAAMVVDLFAIVLLGIALLLVEADVVSKPLLVSEGDRYAKSGSRTMARLSYFLGGVSPVFPEVSAARAGRLCVLGPFREGQQVKHYATFFLIAVMSLGLVFVLFTRAREPHNAPAEVIEIKPWMIDAGADGGPAVASSGTPADAAVAVADAGPAVKPLRIATLGWELSAAGATIGATPAIEIAPENALDALEARLARGGADPQGADVAVMPLPSFVSSYERLRALEPRVFLVVGFSHGREEVHANAGALLKPPPGADEVKVVSGGSESANVLALFAVDVLGVASSRIRLVTAEADVKAAPFAAVVKGTSDTRKLAFSTVDASKLVPIVAIAPKAVLETHEKELQAWSKAWLDGLGAVANDVPGLSRKLASKTDVHLAAGVGGAPEALVLVERLGLIERTTLDQQTSLIGPLAKSPVTLESLMTRTWQLSRGGGLTTAAAPDPLPIDARILTAIAPPPKDAPAPATPEGDAGAAFGPLPTGTVPLVAYRATEGDADKVATQIYFLSGVFERAYFKIQAKGGDKAAKAIAAAARDKGVPQARLATVAGDPPGAVASVEILAPP